MRIEGREMEAFARASGDLNPVHLPGPLASEDPFEAPVAYGVLAVLGALGEMAGETDRGLAAVEATFLRPLRVGAEYDLEVRGSPPQVTACVRDGDLPALRLDARFSGGCVLPEVGTAERLRRPRRRRTEDLAAGTSVHGSYGVDRASLDWLRERFGLRPSAVDDGLLLALLWSSYLVGMVIPGSGALLSRLGVSREEGPHEPAGASGAEPLSYRARVVELQPEVRIATLAGELRHRGEAVARLSCEAHLPPPPRSLDLGLLEREIGGASDRLRGRTALVIGGGRGLGAALAHGLASQGCAVRACSRSGAGRHPSRASWRDAIHHLQGDAADPDQCRRLLDQATDRHGGLDFLICAAAPRLDGIGFSPTPIARFNEFVRRSVELVTVPMATATEALEAKGGSCLVVSSQAVETTPREWGHYVAAKGALEALAVWAANQSPQLPVFVARAPRLDGGPLGDGEDGVAREAVAAWLVRRLANGAGAGAHLLEWPARAAVAAS